VEYARELLTKVKMEPARVEMYNLSAAMGPGWAEICISFTERIRALGPSPLGHAKKRAGRQEGVSER
jgi:F420-non-reducing hydrogenase iron-sulfur subunit